MKNKLITRVSNMVAILAFLALLAGNANATFLNEQIVVSPYWQSDGTSYTFIAVSHTSLSGMASQIGMTINVIQNDKSAFGTAVDFTIQSGTTKKIFIARTGHASINPTNLASSIVIQGTTNYKHGHIRIDPKASNPNIGGRKCVNLADVDSCGYPDVTMLSFWGAVVVEQNSTGFAMEFIGDMHDSAVAPLVNSQHGISVSGPGAP
jgi:hypothetical protein